MTFDTGFNDLAGENSKGTWNIRETRSSRFWVLTDTGACWMPLGNLTTLSALITSYRNIVAELPMDWEKLQMLEARYVSHNALVGTINSSATSETWSSYLSLNNLTKVLHPAWVKFMTLSPNDFLDNHRLCLLYISDNLMGQNHQAKESNNNLHIPWKLKTNYYGCFHHNCLNARRLSRELNWLQR